ncbi:hypothetical protein ABT224_41575 [Streptomyces sp. NPDC001584]|uniref:hypothetical protein n=1 Tax=Streptomyces sp. NPDC001584 TaxID=3154521 RepID=UPI00331EF47A
MSDELPTQRVAGVEYRSCEWCGAAVSQLGTRTPRLYCKRSHRQRAYDARSHGEPMLKDRPPGPKSKKPVKLALIPEPAASPPAPAALPDPPAAVPVVVPVVRPIPDPLPKPARRRSGMTASAIPLSPHADGVREGLDPRGWLRAFDAYEERLQGQGALFEDQEQPDDGSNGPTHGA